MQLYCENYGLISCHGNIVRSFRELISLMLVTIVMVVVVTMVVALNINQPAGCACMKPSPERAVVIYG